MLFLRITLMIFVSSLLGSFNVYAFAKKGEIIIGETSRTIIYLSDPKASVPVYNNTSIDYLVQVNILDSNLEDFDDNFVVTPEVVSLESGGHSNLVLRKIDGEFAQDRESLRYINVLLIPKKKNIVESRDLDYSISMNYKLFIRPDSIRKERPIHESSNKITMEYRDNKIIVSNPTAYHMTFAWMTVDGVDYDFKGRAMLSPFGEIEYPVRELPKKIMFTFLTDRGYERGPYLVASFNSDGKSDVSEIGNVNKKRVKRTDNK